MEELELLSEELRLAAARAERGDSEPGGDRSRPSWPGPSDSDRRFWCSLGWGGVGEESGTHFRGAAGSATFGTLRYS